MVELDEPGVGRAALLAELEADVADDVEAEAHGAYGGLRGGGGGLLRRGSARHRRPQLLIPPPVSWVPPARGEGGRARGTSIPRRGEADLMRGERSRGEGGAAGGRAPVPATGLGGGDGEAGWRKAKWQER